ncbi:GNAT family N-acetyltransferase [Actinokineospora cianjurensis]|uniref:Acetyltransferase (GNAT) family protein n=1 Tax=Actinokineospora cianjurensis TaxID=585224 RepID=A0A421B2B1_9PSEU|nr:GNAT family N-acetyltransferase [Actinokineospora cianjurensis]RLK58499.1 acetyltransferase (GNAT) family protein [Actinokineospora cianjurensis]
MDWTVASGQGLVVRVSDSSETEVFPAFYAGYDRAFVLPDEKEERAGFVECLALNHGPVFERVSARFGAFRELVLAAEVDGVAVGGANVIVTPLPAWSVVTVHLNYVYVLPEARGRGLLRRLVDACRDVASALFPGVGPVVVFLELNDPSRLTAEQYASDSAASGVDQFDRIAIWARLGLRVVDFPYVQPPLSKAQEADDKLLLGVLADPAFRLPGALLGDHLERFFAISVLKTGTIESNLAASEQVSRCREIPEVALVDPVPHLDALRKESGAQRKGFRERLVELTRARG